MKYSKKIGFAFLTLICCFGAAVCMAQPTVPFNIIEINHTVKDYAVWRKAFDQDSTIQKTNGMSLIAVGKGSEKANDLSVVFMLADVAKAKAFAADPRLKDVMEKNGVISKPDISYFKIVRFNPAAKGKQWMTIVVPVKDFDAWLKVFDEEGAAKRTSEGMIDVAIGHGIDNPNLAYIVFYISDLNKAKAAMESNEKKQTMMKSGVVGPPKIAVYNAAE
jgi:hypothetical protein